jgi:hypothetical protein
LQQPHERRSVLFLERYNLKYAVPLASAVDDLLALADWA